MSDPRPPLPAPLDRAALERVLGRAAELQAGTSDTPDLLSEAQLLEIGREVGLSAEHLRQALAEERTRVTLAEETGLAARIAGPAHAAAVRTVSGTPATVLAALDAWMQREECLQVRRRFGERITWEPRRDFMGNIKRGLNMGGRGYSLARAGEVAATVTAIDGARVLVRLDADLSEGRTARLRAGGAAAAIGTTSGLGWVAVVSGVIVPTLPIVAAVGGIAMLAAAAGGYGGYRIARAHQAVVERAQLALEQVLDQLELGLAAPKPPSLASVAKASLLGMVVELDVLRQRDRK
jgi:hypothetical protein